MSTAQDSDASQIIDPGEERQQRVLDQFHCFPFSSDEAFQVRLFCVPYPYTTPHSFLARSFWDPRTRVNESDVRP